MIVSKATSIYVIMVVALVAGLWLILEMGSTIVPPTDLAGKWELSGAGGKQDLSVEQSGKFVDLAMGKWTASLKMESDGEQNLVAADKLRREDSLRQNAIVLAGEGEFVSFVGLGVGDACTIRFEGTVSGEYQARRASKTYR